MRVRVLRRERRWRARAGTLGDVDVITLGHGDETVRLGAAVVPDVADPYAGGSFEIELRGAGMTATRTVFVYASSGLASFFIELAEAWRGWEGSKVWESPEH